MPKNSISISIGAVTLAFAGVATLAAIADAPPAIADTDFVREASRMNQTEIAGAQAILKTTTDPRVRQYAQTMIAQHSTANVELRVAARKANLTVPAFRTDVIGGVTASETPPPGRSARNDAPPVVGGDLAHSGSTSASSAGKADTPGILAPATAPPQTGPQSYTRGDLAYLQSQVAMHQRALKLMQSEAKSGQNADLRSYASDQSDVVQHHLDVASADLDNGASPAPSTAPSAISSPGVQPGQPNPSSAP